jgi:hypothetical protein
MKHVIPKQLEESTPGRAKTPKIGDRKVGLYFLNTTPLCDRRFVGSFRASWSGFFKLFRYKFLFLPLALLLFLGVKNFCHKSTDGFQILKIISSLPAMTEWDTPSASKEELDTLHHHFLQPFDFLGSGGQCYAFLSRDGKTVLKLFKMHHLHQFPWLYHFCLPGIFDRLRIQFLLGQKQKLERTFKSSLIAFRELKEETGLLYLNLNPTPTLKNSFVTLVDKLGISHTLNMANIPFALQRRADNAFRTLRKNLAHRDLTAAKDVIEKIVACLNARYEKGIRDIDPSLRRNLGLLEDRAIFIDIGSFTPAQSVMSPKERQQELRHDTWRMRKWLDKRSPELTSHFDSLIKKETVTRDEDLGGDLKDQPLE